MKIVCDNCSTKYSIADEKVRGKVFKIKCKKCSHVIVVKGQEQTGEGQPAGFDQKETRVFDYSGFDGAKEGQGGQAADPIWHLVIDREQVGPLTVAELAHKFQTGEIDGETYAWREGFDDWKRLAAVDELASITGGGGGGEAAARSEGLFGAGTSPSTDAGGAGRADPADLFAGANASVDDEAADAYSSGGGSAKAQPAAVFSSSQAPAEKPAAASRRSAAAAAAVPRDEQPLFSVAAAESGAPAYSEPTSAGKADVRPMTAQRNENSVLFSLNSLAALATGGAEPAQPKSSVGAGFGSSGPEGSGLIDIRAMAAMTLGGGKKDEGPRLRASDDDLPVFSASSFSTPAAAVLLPTVQPANNRLLYILVGVFGFLILLLLVIFGVLFFGGRKATSIGETPPPVQVASAPSAAPSAPSAVPAAPPASPSAAPAAPPAPSPAAAPAAPTPAPAPAPAAPPAPSKPDRHKPERPAPVETAPRTSPPPAPTPAPAPTEPPPPPKPTAQKCDEVACIVTPDLPCCPKKGGAAHAAPAATPAPSAAPADSGLAEKLDQSDIIAGMKNVNGRVLGCNDKARGAGAFKVKVTVGTDGSVSSASAGPPVAGTAAAGCVEAAVRGAHFKRTKQSITFNYPYTFR
jgi:predicted Zn finger-like uncharacterized protein